MTSWKFYLNSQDAWDAMYADCATAKHSIDLEQYIFHDEPTHRRFIELFKKKAIEGISVKLLLDMVGSFDFYESSWVRELREAGVKIVFFHPISPWRIANFTSWFFRDHRKLLVIDEHIGHTGGVGFNAKTKDWRDTNIRIVGPVVEQMVHAFERISKYSPEFHDSFAFITNAPHPRQRHFYKNLLQALRSARHRIYITTPYFIPPVRLFRALRKAARRGIDVRVLLPRSSDHFFVDLAAQSFFGLAFRAGIKIYRYDTPLLHAKTSIVDDHWGAVGSSNFDHLSFVRCYEANIVTTNLDCIRELAVIFANDIEKAEPLERATWKRRSLVQKILEPFTWPLHGFF